MLVIAAIPMAILAADLNDTDLEVTGTAEIGSGASFGSTPEVSIGTDNDPATNSLTVGHDLIAGSANSLVLGTWNTSVANGYLVVGIGTGSGNKTNAFEVRSDGAVLINEEQGDVPTGVFGN